MKKLSFYFLATVVVASLAACGSDGSCSMEGNWKVKSADVSSDKLDKSVLMMAKDMMLATTYNFTTDSITINTGGTSGQYQGSYTVDATGTTLSWSTIGGTSGTTYNDNMKIVSCGGGEVTLLKRSPTDTTQAEMTKTKLWLVM